MFGYFRGMAMQDIRSELATLGIVLTDAQFNSLTYAELNSIGRKAFKAYKLTHQVGNIVEGAINRSAPTTTLVSDDTPSVPDGEFR